MARELYWDGITKSKTLDPLAARERNRVADNAKGCGWSELIAILAGDPHLVNTTRPDGKAAYAPLHHAAFGGAPVDTVHHLLKLGAFRTLRDSQGSRPVDIAFDRGHRHLLAILEPEFKRRMGPDVLSAIQGHFHALIRERASELVSEHSLRLPELEIVLEFTRTKFWFAIPGMYGGFVFWLVGKESEPKLITESWCRVAEGSGQRHEITEHGSRLIDEGFV